MNTSLTNRFGSSVICNCHQDDKKVRTLISAWGTETNAESHYLRREPKRMTLNRNYSDDSDRSFSCQTSESNRHTEKPSPRYLWTGESWWCQCSHKVSQHLSKSPFIANCSGGGGRCPCKEFVAYRNISWEARD